MLIAATPTGTQIGVMVAWALLVIGLGYLIRTTDKAVGAMLAPVFSLLVALFIVYAAGAFGIDLEKVKDLVDSDDGGTSTGTTPDG